MHSNTKNTHLSRNRQIRKITLLSLSALFIILGIIYFAYWFSISRHYQSTEDAYVSGNQVQIMSQVSGNVKSIHHDTTDYVQKGDVLVTLDDTDAKLALEAAKVELARTVRETQSQIINTQQLKANIELKEALLEIAKADSKRRKQVGATAVGIEVLQHAEDAVKTAQMELEVAKQQYNASHVLILDSNDIRSQPNVQAAATKVKNAWLALERTKITSPISGFVSRRSAQVGQQITTSTPLMVVVPLDQVWIDANFKETQIANMRINQTAEITTDLYGEDVVFHGKITGIDVGTGAAFSLLPAQNATGNWIKVIQRLPVRIELNAEDLKKHPLRIGLSSHVKVDTSNREGDVLIEKAREDIAYHSEARILDLSQIDKVINEIIDANHQALNQ